MTWDDIDWPVLERLRQGFLSGTAAEGPYWQSREDLAQYDFTFAERIGWKWDHVLRELRQRGWSPPPGALLDWGCGSGVAHRRVIDQWSDSITEVAVFDHSLLAQNYALAQLATTQPALPAGSWERSSPITTLVISHVLNELDADAATDLRATIASAQAVIWIEPGTADVAGSLVAWREQLCGDFNVVYPCPHQSKCGMLAPANGRDWCHHFASPPPTVGGDSNWVKFGQRMGIDLRSLPYSGLVLDRRPMATPAAPEDTVSGRIIGRPKVSKPFARFLGCDETGVSRLELPKRVAPKLVKKLDRPGATRRAVWSHDNNIITRFQPDPAVDP
jgi:hypothetical protein